MEINVVTETKTIRNDESNYDNMSGNGKKCCKNCAEILYYIGQRKYQDTDNKNKTMW